MTHPADATPADATPIGDGLPRIAVVVAAHDAEAYLAETLDSVLAQTFRAWECIVVDDGSTDGTAAVAERYVARDDRFRSVRQTNAGVSAARNAGLDVVSAEVTLLAFLDSDDTWLPDALAVLVAALGDDAALVGVYGTAEYMDPAGRPLRPGAHVAAQSDRRRLGRVDLVGVPHGAPSTWSTLIVSGTIWPSGVALHRREAVERAGRFDPAQKYVEDWDLYLRMSRSGSFRPVHRQVAWYRQHAANLTKHGATMAYHSGRVRWTVWRSGENTPAQLRESQRVWRRLQLRWILWCVAAVTGSLRAHDTGRAREAAAAVVLLTRQLLAGHPAEPDVRTAHLVDRFVAPRWAGKGSS